MLISIKHLYRTAGMYTVVFRKTCIFASVCVYNVKLCGTLYRNSCV